MKASLLVDIGLIVFVVLIVLFYTMTAWDFRDKCDAAGGVAVNNNFYSRLCVDSDGRIIPIG